MKKMKRTFAVILALAFCLAGLNVGAANGSVAGEQISFDLEKNFQLLDVDVAANRVEIKPLKGIFDDEN